jgi:hypothetical protein
MPYLATKPQTTLDLIYLGLKSASYFMPNFREAWPARLIAPS